MTNPTLERAARALFDATGADWDAISPTRQQYVVTATRAVLMAVLSELERYDSDYAGAYKDERGDYVRYEDLQAILNDGEGE